MDFLIVPIAAGPPGAPAAILARGPDPLIAIPPNSALFRIAGLTFIVPPGALVAAGTCLHASVVSALLGPAIFVGTAAAPVPSRAMVPLVNGILPTKFDAILTQLEAEPPGVGLTAGANYASPEARLASSPGALCAACVVAAGCGGG